MPKRALTGKKASSSTSKRVKKTSSSTSKRAKKSSSGSKAATERAALVTKVVSIMERLGRVTQEQIKNELPGVDGKEYTRALGTLQMSGRLKVMNKAEDNTILFELFTASERVVKKKLRTKGLTTKARFVYQLIEKASDLGTWTRTLRKQTGLLPAAMNKVLKKLEQLELVRPWTLKNRKTYMLWDLKPAPTLGFSGPFFDDGSLDKVFIQQIYQITLEYIGRSTKQRQGGVTLHELMVRLIPALASGESSTTEIEAKHMEQLLDILILDRVVERIEIPGAAGDAHAEALRRSGAAASSSSSSSSAVASSALALSGSAKAASASTSELGGAEGEETKGKRLYRYRVVNVIDSFTSESNEAAWKSAADAAVAETALAEQRAKHAQQPGADAAVAESALAKMCDDSDARLHQHLAESHIFFSPFGDRRRRKVLA